MDIKKNINIASLVKKTYARIESEHVTPRPKWQFLLKNWVFWLFGILSIILGSISFSTIIFLFVDHDATARTYLNESIFEDILQTIPYLWIIVLLILIGISQYAVRHTDRGYRYRTSRVIAGVVSGSILLGSVFSLLEVGEQVEDFLILRAPYYDELTYTTRDTWSHPERGLLGGTVTEAVTGTEFGLKDFHNKIWRVDLGHIEPTEAALIKVGSTIKIVGSQEDVATFRAARILSWSKQ